MNTDRICKFCNDEHYDTDSDVSCLKNQVKILAHAIKYNFCQINERIIGNSESDADCTGSVMPAWKIIKDMGL
jgi:hypothetical protein